MFGVLRLDTLAWKYSLGAVRLQTFGLGGNLARELGLEAVARYRFPEDFRIRPFV